MAARTLLMDLDGTLVDTVPDLTAALNRLMRQRGLGHFTTGEVSVMVGDGVPVLLERAFAARRRAADPGAVAEFMADYQAHVADESRLYPDVLAELSALHGQGWRLAVCTNKPERTARALLQALGVMPLLCAVGGGDSFAARKPAPAHLLATLDLAQGVPERAVMLGDHRNDIACTAGTGVASIFAAWGYGKPDMAQGATAVADNIGHAAALATRLLPCTAP